MLRARLKIDPKKTMRMSPICIERESPHLMRKEPNRGVSQFHLVLTLLLLSWMCNGIVLFLPFYRAIMFYAVFAMWFLLSLGLHPQYLSTLLAESFLLVVFLSAVIVQSIHSYGAIDNVSFSYVFVFIIFCMYVYYREESDPQLRRALVGWTLLELLASSLYSLSGLRADPLLVRKITAGITTDIPTALVATFGTIYAGVGYVVFLACSLQHFAGRFRGLLFAVGFTTTLLVVQSSLAIAFLSLVMFVLWALVTRRVSGIIILSPLIFLGLGRVLPVAINLLEVLARADWLSQILSARLVGLADFLYGAQSDVSLRVRLDDYRNSMQIFLHSPIWGVYGNMVISRGHNYWIDLFANFGVVRSLPLLAFLVRVYRDIESRLPRMLVRGFRFVWVYFLLVGLINPINRADMWRLIWIVIPFSSSMLPLRAPGADIRTCGR